MAHLSRAVLRSALENLKTLLSPARGRHSARRRRSTRVRRYAPTPAPAPPVPAPAAERVGTVPAPPEPGPAPRPAPPREEIPADDVALVRPYYAAHERELARVREAAARRPRARTAAPTDTAPTPAAPRVPEPRPVPEGDLLAPLRPRSGEFDELRDLTRIWIGRHRRNEVAAV
ncbi:hypothetical protein KIK06_18785 [Nocardiopsis sp. EMB25]|uniref:hypothetical protein n=1 Tax=Nocardiopsis sp. EMB25 TaxID=2835867 RepID=UPI0022832E83|nr:hypothetical protein [Nocardiopsis sp. EMB25]MCY9785939.1 hypothetical protein [Nocardiopsis sp. EMB25]